MEFLFPFLNLVKVFAVVSTGDWGARTVLSRSNLDSMEWRSWPQKNSWVANSCLGKQTDTSPPDCIECVELNWEPFDFIGTMLCNIIPIQSMNRVLHRQFIAVANFQLFSLVGFLQSKFLFPLCQLYGYTNIAPLPVIKLKAVLMASNSISTIQNQSKSGK